MIIQLCNWNETDIGIFNFILHHRRRINRQIRQTLTQDLVASKNQARVMKGAIKRRNVGTRPSSSGTSSRYPASDHLNRRSDPAFLPFECVVHYTSGETRTRSGKRKKREVSGSTNERNGRNTRNLEESRDSEHFLRFLPARRTGQWLTWEFTWLRWHGVRWSKIFDWLIFLFLFSFGPLRRRTEWTERCIVTWII